MNNKLKKNLTFWIFVGIGLGLLTGLIFKESSFALSSATFASTIFIRLLKMLIVPLILTSIISGVVGIGDAKGIGRMGLRTFIYYMSTSLLAIVTGLIIVNMVKPGLGIDIGLASQVKKLPIAEDGTLIDIFIRMIPVNIFSDMAAGKTLPLIFFSLLFGFFITQIKSDYKGKLTDLFKAAFETMMKFTHFVMWFAPIGVWGFMTKLVINTGFGAFASLAWYAMCVVLALLVHATVTLPLILAMVGKANPLRFIKHMSPALLTAFSTSSSSATLPLTIECLEDNAKVSNKVSSFVLPLGATINMDGTALYECVAVMFIAQAYGIELSLFQQGIVVLTALLASIGAAGVPMAGLVMMSIILTAVGLPLEGVGIILAVDRILDMCRTTINVWSDSCGAATIARLEGEKLPELR